MKNFRVGLICFVWVFLGATLNFYISQNSQDIEYNSENSFALTKLTKVKRSRGPASSGTRGLNVVINEGEVAYLDESTSVDTLTIHGELHCDEEKAPNVMELRAKTIIVTGVFQCGTTSNPYNKKMIISLKDSDLDPKQDSGYRGLIVHMGGQLNFNGGISKAGWTKLARTANPGENFIILESKNKLVSASSGGHRRRFATNRVERYPWQIGDTIAIGPTGYNYAEAESFTIAGFDERNPNKVYINGVIQHRHYGEGPQKFNTRAMGDIHLDERAEVANLSRNIVIRADEQTGLIGEGDGENDQRGGHIMVHHMGKAYLNSVELYKMGQAGVMARYPFHWHHVGDAHGQYVKNSSIHHSYQRCITIHRTNHVLLQNNVCYNFKGHGYFLEDGTEQNNRIIRNLAMKASPPSDNKVLLASDRLSGSENQGRFPSVSGFWISHPNNFIMSNIVSGSVGSGLWMSFEKEVMGMGAQSGTVVATPLTSATDTFNYNHAHSCKVGITWDGAPAPWLPANNPNNPNDHKLASAHYSPPTIPVFKGLRAWKNYFTGIYFRGQTAIYKNNVVADNGWGYWMAYNQIIRDSVFIAKTNNQSNENDDFFFSQARPSRFHRSGIVLYDGPFEVHDSDFIDYDQSEQSYLSNSNQTINSTTIPITSTGGSNKFTNYVAGIHFDPEPYHRAYLASENESMNERSILGNAIIRDADGSFSGTGVNSVITGKRSLGITSQDNCLSGGTSLKNFKVCPGRYTEGSLGFMHHYGGLSMWSTPFIVMRDDGALNYPKNEWSQIWSRPNNLFATVNSNDRMYTILAGRDFEYVESRNAFTAIDANTESSTPNAPVLKVVGYGRNCRLDPNQGPVESFSLNELKSKNTTSWFTDGDTLYVRALPTDRWKMITDSSLVTATSNSTKERFRIHCDGAIPKRVKGKITSVHHGQTHTTIKGWACNYKHFSSIWVELYAYGPLISHSTTDPSKFDNDDYDDNNNDDGGGGKGKSLLSANAYTFIDKIRADDSTPPRTAFDCGYMTGAGRGFEFSIPNNDLSQFSESHRVYIKGLSNSNGEDLFIENSGRYTVIPKDLSHHDSINHVRGQ